MTAILSVGHSMPHMQSWRSVGYLALTSSPPVCPHFQTSKITSSPDFHECVHVFIFCKNIPGLLPFAGMTWILLHSHQELTTPATLFTESVLRFDCFARHVCATRITSIHVHLQQSPILPLENLCDIVPCKCCDVRHALRTFIGIPTAVAVIPAVPLHAIPTRHQYLHEYLHNTYT